MAPATEPSNPPFAVRSTFGTLTTLGALLVVVTGVAFFAVDSAVDTLDDIVADQATWLGIAHDIEHVQVDTESVFAVAGISGAESAAGQLAALDNIERDIRHDLDALATRIAALEQLDPDSDLLDDEQQLAGAVTVELGAARNLIRSHATAAPDTIVQALESYARATTQLHLAFARLNTSIWDHVARRGEVRRGQSSRMRVAQALVLATLLLIALSAIIHGGRIARLRRQMIENQARRLREVAEARDRADSASTAKSNFLAHMSHEIRTPMNGVIGIADLLSTTALDPHQRHLVMAIRRSGDSLIRLINDQLDMAKIEAGGFALRPAVFDYRAMLGEIATLFSERCARQDVELRVDYPVTGPRRVVADELRIRQALTNLAANAVRYTRSGSISLRAALEEDGSSTHLALTVRDTGPGIPPAELERIFEPFAQVGDSSAAVGGTGIGLTISRQLIDLMGGSIEARSVLGEGSTFECRIPVQIDPDDQPLRRIGDGNAPGILLAVAHSGQRARLRQALQDMGLGVVEPPELAKGLPVPARAFASCADYQFAIVDAEVLDAATHGQSPAAPGGGGPEFPVILLLDILATGAERACMNHAVAGIVFTPVRWLELHALLERLVHPASTAPPAAHPLAAEVLPPDHRRRVLIVDDNEINRLLVRGMVDNLGMSAVLACDGRESVVAHGQAVDRGAAFDLILMDCLMPNLDGFDATRRIRTREADDGLPPVPIVALTANILANGRAECLSAGMDDVLSKPIRLADLRAVIEHWIGIDGATDARRSRWRRGRPVNCPASTRRPGECTAGDRPQVAGAQRRDHRRWSTMAAVAIAALISPWLPAASTGAEPMAVPTLADELLVLAHDDPRAAVDAGRRNLTDTVPSPDSRLFILLAMGRASQWLDDETSAEVRGRLAREPGELASALATVFEAQADIESDRPDIGLAKLDGAIPRLAAGAPYWKATADMEVCDALVTAGRSGDWRAACDRARAAWMSSSRPLELARTENLISLAYWSLGDHAIATRHARSAREQFGRAGTKGGVAMMDANLAELSLQSGNAADALTLAAQSLAYEEAHGKATHALSSQNTRAAALVALGRPSEALAVLDAAIARARSLKASRILEDLLATRLDARSRSGSPEQVAADARELVAAVRSRSNDAVATETARLSRLYDIERKERQLKALELQQRVGELESSAARSELDLAKLRADRWMLWSALVLLLGLGAVVQLLRLRRRNRELLEDIRRRTELIGQAFHEVRNPMVSVAGLLDVALLSLEGHPIRPLVTSARAAAAAVAESAQHQLDAVQVARDAVELHPHAFDPRELVRQVCELLSPDAWRKKLRLDHHVAADVPSALVGDEARIRQVIWNIASNAVKFTDTGSVGIDADYTADGRFRITVSDTGPGLSEADLERIFEPFQRVGDVSSRSYGVGLGLSVALKLVECMGGSITPTVAAGAGMRFTIELPLPASAPDADAAIGETPDRFPIDVLVVEDDPFMAELLTAQLGQLGVHAVIAHSLDDALSTVVDFEPALVLVDYHLGSERGTELIARLRSRKATRVPRIVVVSASQPNVPRVLSPDEQPDIWLRKPISLESLEEQVRIAAAA